MIVTTIFFIVTFIVLLDDLFVSTILPNTSLSVFIHDILFALGAFISAILNLFSGLLRLELRIQGLIEVIIKFFAYMGASIVNVITDIIGLPFRILSDLLDVKKITVLNGCAKVEGVINILETKDCANLYDPALSVSQLRKQDGGSTNYSKIAWWIFIDLEHASINIGFFSQVFNFVSGRVWACVPFTDVCTLIADEVIQDDSIWFAVGVALAGGDMMGFRDLSAISFTWDLQAFIGSIGEFQLLGVFHEFLQTLSDSFGTWEEVYWKELGGG